MNNFGMRSFSMFPPVIKGLIITNVVVFVLQHLFFEGMMLQGSTLGDWFFRTFALWPTDTMVDPYTGVALKGAGSFAIWQLFTYQFMHAGFGHIFFNLFALWMFGMEVENMWGSRKFLVFYLLCGLGAGLTQLFILPLFETPLPTVGASGSVYGILLAFVMSFPERSILMFPFFIPIKAKYFIFIMIGFGLIGGMSDSNIAHLAHLGGLATGYLLYKFGDQMGIYRLFEGKGSSGGGFSSRTSSGQQFYEKPQRPDGVARIFSSNWSNREPEPRQAEPKMQGFSVDGERVTQQKIDEILDKISASGYENLTAREKQILLELSNRLNKK